MSYDVTLYGPTTTEPCECPRCYNEHEAQISETLFSRNHTSNTAGMWYTAGCDLGSFHDKTGRELAEALEPALEKIRTEPETYKPMAPDNGWGTYESTVKFLSKILAACREYPDSRVSISR